MPVVHYEEHPARPELRHLVHSVWTLRYPSATPTRFLVVPSGCAELVVNLGYPVEQLVAGQRRKQHPISYVAEIDRPFHIGIHGDASMVGVRVLPSGAQAFTWPGLFTHETYGAYSLPPNLVAFIHRHVIGRPPVAAAAHLQLGLLEHLHRRPGRPEVAAVVQRMAHSERWHEAVQTMSRRQLERLFREQVGMAPQALANVLRFRKALDALPSYRGRLADLAAETGYADQAHLSREFKRYTGQTPSDFLEADHALAKLKVGP